MSLEDLIQSVPSYVLVLFRVAGMMMFAPLLGSGRIPRRVKALLAVGLAIGVMPAAAPPLVWPETTWGLALGLGGEISFGLAMGMALSFVFIGTQWAGDMIGQQMGFDLAAAFDPQFGTQGSLVGEFYYMLTLVVFLAARGHHAMIRGVADSFRSLPLLSVGVDQPLFDLVLGLFQSCTALAFRLAGPMFVTMLVVDVALGFLSKTVPQLNVMSVGMSLRSVIGLVVMILGIGMTADVIGEAIADAMVVVSDGWAGISLVPSPGTPGEG